MFWETRKHNIFNHIVLIIVILVFCFSCKADASFNEDKQISNSSNLYDDIIANINKDSYDELDWMTEEPTGGIIVYDGYKLYDIDNDGIDELFVLRKYVNNQERDISDIKKITSISDYNRLAIRRGFISESYKIVDEKPEPFIIDNEIVSTQAFQGGHFGIYYFLLNDGKIVKFYNSYWNETLIIYDKKVQETTITYDGDMETGEWEWKINGISASKNDAYNIIKYK